MLSALEVSKSVERVISEPTLLETSWDFALLRRWQLARPGLHCAVSSFEGFMWLSLDLGRRRCPIRAFL